MSTMEKTNKLRLQLKVWAENGMRRLRMGHTAEPILRAVRAISNLPTVRSLLSPSRLHIPYPLHREEKEPEVMAVNNTIMHTDSEKTSSYRYMKRRAVHLMIKCRVEKFEELMNSTEPGKGVLWSKYVSSTLSPRVIWKLELYPNGETRKYRNNVSIYLNLTGPMAKKKETLQASFRLYLISGSDGTSDTMLSCTYDFGEENYNWGMPKVSHNRVKKALRADGSLLVAAEVDFLPPDDHTLDVDLLQWPTNFSKFYGDVGSSDCRIEIGGVAIPAHKFPLMACSPVFKEMFTNPAAEEFKSGVIKVTDFQRPESMRALVRYCYQGMLDVETMDGEWGMEIFKLAAKYCIDDLKAVLEEHFIERRLSEQNVIEMALLADSYFASKLKEACIELIVEEGDIVFESPDWKRLEKTRPKLAIQLAIAAYREK